jgi:D-alanyl-D-alanine carboxypeptidase (penicillin-binding protein 5/6)
MQLIAVVMGAQSRDERNEAARKLLDYGFSNFAIYEKGEEYLENCKVSSGTVDQVPLYASAVSFVIERSLLSSVEVEYDLPEVLNAPLSKGDKVGEVTYKYGNNTLFVSEVYVGEDVKKISVGDIFVRILKNMILG